MAGASIDLALHESYGMGVILQEQAGPDLLTLHLNSVPYLLFIPPILTNWYFIALVVSQIL